MIYKILPNFIFSKLFGDRKKFGQAPKLQDPCWKEWQNRYVDFYKENQREGIGHPINESGYRILEKVEMQNKLILEIGPGGMPHIAYLSKEIAEYCVVDINEEMLKITSDRLREEGIPHRCIKIEKDQQQLPFAADSFDIIISFYALEHIYPLSPYIGELHRVLKPNGLMVGAIPAEGGFAWGLGRYLTSRRWFLKNTKINPDKIICWEHPNFANTIMQILGKKFIKRKIIFWPFNFLKLFDTNLIIKFIYQKN